LTLSEELYGGDDPMTEGILRALADVLDIKIVTTTHWRIVAERTRYVR